MFSDPEKVSQMSHRIYTVVGFDILVYIYWIYWLFYRRQLSVGSSTALWDERPLQWVWAHSLKRNNRWCTATVPGCHCALYIVHSAALSVTALRSVHTESTQLLSTVQWGAASANTAASTLEPGTQLTVTITLREAPRRNSSIATTIITHHIVLSSAKCNGVSLQVAEEEEEEEEEEE